ncbi:MAG: hypothetical protein ABII90_09450 [Bacteroidota bacterium]
MKKFCILFLTAIVFTTFAKCFAQDVQPGSVKENPDLTAVFNYTEAALEQSIESNNVMFYVKNLNNAEKIEAFQNKASVYAEYFTISLSDSEDKGVKQCKVDFKNNDAKMNILFRFFISNQIKKVDYNGTKVKTEEFFRGIM